MLSKEELGLRIKEARQMKSNQIGRKYTQAMLANDIGISQGYLGDIERGRRYPNYALLSKISDACGIQLSFFDEDPLDSLRSRLRTLRQKRNVSQEFVAKAINIDMDTYVKIEEGKINPTVRILDDIALLFDCSLDYLTGTSEDDPDACILATGITAPDGSLITVWNLPPLPGIDTSRYFIAPIVSSITGGSPTFSTEEVEGYMYVDPVMAGVNENDRLYYLRVTSDSMTPKYQVEDLVLIRQQSTISDGEVAAVLIKEKEACLRKVYFTNDDIWLHSTNPAYEPVKVKADDVLILGKAIYRLG